MEFRPALAIWIGLALTGATRAEGVEVGADVGFASQYVSRGITWVNRPVLQPGLWVSQPLGDFGVTLGVWSNVELGKYDARSAISNAGGARAFDLSELDPSLELSWAPGELELVTGIVGYLYPNGSGLTHADDAAEVYARLELPGWLGLSHSFALYQDVSEIHGSYLELATSRSFTLREELALVGSVALGWSEGQDARYNVAGEEREEGNFASDGLTHWELGLALPFAWRSLWLEPSVHLVFGHDDWTKAWSMTSERDVKAWVGLTLSASSGSDE